MNKIDLIERPVPGRLKVNGKIITFDNSYFFVKDLTHSEKKDVRTYLKSLELGDNLK